MVAQGMGQYCSKPCSNRARKQSLYERFNAFAEQTELPTDGRCWIWPGPKDKEGYGVISDENRKQIRVHRLSYEMWIARIPEGKYVLHSCDNPPCFNPSHLRTGTGIENTAERDAKGRQQRGERHHRARLTEADVRAIRVAYEAGATQTALGIQHGVTQRQVSEIVLRRAWKHV